MKIKRKTKTSFYRLEHIIINKYQLDLDEIDKDARHYRFYTE